jgi:hypothetical protein
MHARPKPPFTPVVRTVVAFAVVSVVGLCAVVAARQDLPLFRQGMWKFNRTVNGKAIESSKCTVPTDDMKRQNATLQKTGCTFSPIQKSGNTYTFKTDCEMKMPGGTISSHTTSVLTMESDSAYRLDITGTTDGAPTKESLVARRVGECSR